MKTFKEALVKSPCREACPADIDIPRYLRYIAQGHFNEAFNVIREKIPFPWVCGMVCTHPCELKCRLNDIDEPVAIRILKRFVSEQPEHYGLFPETQAVMPLRPVEAAAASTKPATQTSGKKVAIVGSGPAGLTAGYYLAKLGHAITVFETHLQPGGMMQFGVPRYRLPQEILDAEIEGIKRAGVEIRTNTKVDSINSLIKKFDAVFVAIGSHKEVKLGIPHEDISGVVDGVSFLGNVNTGKMVELGERVGIIGGGNVAVDAARTAIRLGTKKVMILYRRNRDEMPAAAEEIDDALQEGVEIAFLTAPKKITRLNGKLKVECLLMKLGAPDDTGRPCPEPISGSEFELEFDSLVAAVGQEPNIDTDFGLQLTRENTIKVEEDSLATSVKGVFAGGDVVTGPASIISAIAAGRKAAVKIDQYLGGKGNIDEIMAPPESVVEPWRWGLYIDERLRRPLREVASRIESFAKVELPIDAEAAIKEAKRCLRCDLLVAADSSYCVNCLTCVLRCSQRKTGSFNPVKAALKVYRLPSGEMHIEFTDDCDLCGLCARYCPYGAITREKSEVGLEVN